MLEILSKPWPWYVAGPLIGLTVPALLLLGNKKFGISSTFRHICAACVPAGIPYFTYDWRKERWNFVFIAGIMLGAFFAATVLNNPVEMEVATATKERLMAWGITDFSSLLPMDVFSWQYLLSLKGLIFYVLGGFLVGFGTRYAGGCTSGHSIYGLSTLQWPSLVATICFMAGGFFSANILLPLIFSILN